MSKLKLVDVNKYYGEGISRVHVLKDVSFSAKAGELNLILGPSGSGKSTFLTIAGGLQTPTSGKVLIDGIDIEKLSSKNVMNYAYRRLVLFFSRITYYPI